MGDAGVLGGVVGGGILLGDGDMGSMGLVESGVTEPDAGGVVTGAGVSGLTDGSGCGVLGGLLQAVTASVRPRPASN